MTSTLNTKETSPCEVRMFHRNPSPRFTIIQLLTEEHRNDAPREGKETTGPKREATMSVERKRKEKSVSKNVTAQSAKRWVKLAHYCKESGDTKDAVQARRKKGVWLDGVQTCKAPNGKIYVCPEAAYQWVENGTGVMQ